MLARHTELFTEPLLMMLQIGEALYHLMKSRRGTYRC